MSLGPKAVGQFRQERVSPASPIFSQMKLVLVSKALRPWSQETRSQAQPRPGSCHDSLWLWQAPAPWPISALGKGAATSPLAGRQVPCPHRLPQWMGSKEVEEDRAEEGEERTNPTH